MNLIDLQINLVTEWLGTALTAVDKNVRPHTNARAKAYLPARRFTSRVLTASDTQALRLPPRIVLGK